MAVIELPVRNDLPNYEFKSELDGVVYTLRFRFNERLNDWVFD